MPRFAHRWLFGLLLSVVLCSLGSCEGGGSYTRLAPDAGVPGSGGSTGDGAIPSGSGGAGGAHQPEGGAGAGGTVTGGNGGTATGGSAATGGGSGTGGGAATGGGAGGATHGTGGAPGGHGGTAVATGGAAGGGTGTGGKAGATGSGGSPGTGGAAGGSQGGSAGALGGKAGAGGAGSGAGGAAQRILSVDFVGGVSMGAGGGVSGTVAMGRTEVAGVKPAANWNGAPGAAGSLSALLLSDGTPATGAAVSWNAPTYATGAGIFAIGYPDMPGDVRMLNGYLDPAWSTLPSSPVTVVSFTGLPPVLTTGGYDVYVYVVGSVMSAQTRGYNYNIGSKAFRVTQTGPISTSPTSPYPYVLAPDGGSGNYIVFRNVTGAAFDLQVKPDSGGPVFRSPINGIQIVWPSGS